MIGETTRARQLLGESLALHREQGNLRFVAIPHAMLGTPALLDNDLDAAALHFAEALAGHHRVGNRRFVVFDLKGLAAVLLARGQARRAVGLFAAALTLGETLGEARSQIGGSTWGKVPEQARVCLGEQPFAVAWSEGRRMSRDEAIAYALASVASFREPELRGEPSRREVGASSAAVLTRREREVAERLARRQGDRQIADALFISPGTVGGHVHNILVKLGLRSRWLVADWLAEQAVTTQSESSDESIRRSDHPGP